MEIFTFSGELIRIYRGYIFLFDMIQLTNGKYMDLIKNFLGLQILVFLQIKDFTKYALGWQTDKDA